MLKGTWFLFILLIVILASSMVFGSWGALEGYATDASNKQCKGPECGK